MVGVAQLVRAPVCGIGGRGFEPLLPPQIFSESLSGLSVFFCVDALFFCGMHFSVYCRVKFMVM